MAKQPDDQTLKADAEATSAKITAQVAKLGAKFREKAEAAGEKVKHAKSEEKRDMHRRRFELYGDAATDLEERARQMGGGRDGADD